ncbi:MAG: septum site-determining protein MinC [Chloroflexi bacterium]|nr:septum site-determining protein MinC [Chloroflexota bacterium]
MPEKMSGAPDKITIKGIRQGLLVILGDGQWPSRVAALQARLANNLAFFQGGRVVLNLESRRVSRAELEEIRALLAAHDVELMAVLSTDLSTRSVVGTMGLAGDVDAPPRRPAETPVESTPETLLEGLVIRKTLRSGQDLRHPGHIVVIGDVNPGAEIIAGGDIVVWGKVRGVVHAGAMGDERAVICALDLQPTQLRIAGHITVSPEGRRRKTQPEMASVQDGQIVAVAWRGK